jgi:lactate dehydrogenase-like 2-hydroxyacid dehydrogenase
MLLAIARKPPTGYTLVRRNLMIGELLGRAFGLLLFITLCLLFIFKPHWVLRVVGKWSWMTEARCRWFEKYVIRTIGIFGLGFILYSLVYILFTCLTSPAS